MKLQILVLLLAVSLQMSEQFSLHSSKFLHKKHSLKNKSKVHLRLQSKVQLKSLNLEKASQHRMTKGKNGKFELNAQNAEDFYSKCTDGLSGAEKVAKVADFTLIGQKMVDALQQQLSTNLLDTFWFYFVKADGGECDVSNENLGFTFMMMPKGNPMTLDFSDPNNRVGFLKVCQGGDSMKGGETKDDTSDRAKKPYLLQNCAFDNCKTTRYQDLQEITNKDDAEQKIKGNCVREIDEDESVTIQNSQNKASLKISGVEQINSIGKFMN